MEKKVSKHGGKREGAGRPEGSKNKEPAKGRTPKPRFFIQVRVSQDERKALEERQKELGFSTLSDLIRSKLF
ncbi:MAG: hypothetical protein FWE37_02200 [Spirochaetaceae bacterium]|nr:hypothetical protein [Spirochaetaceae bacterium]